MGAAEVVGETEVRGAVSASGEAEAEVMSFIPEAVMAFIATRGVSFLTMRQLRILPASGMGTNTNATEMMMTIKK
jgi:hypothetical protein